MNFNFNQGFRPMGFEGMPQMHFPSYTSATPQPMITPPAMPQAPQTNPGTPAQPAPQANPFMQPGYMRQAHQQFRQQRQDWMQDRPEWGTQGFQDWRSQRPQFHTFMQGLLPNFG